MKCECNVAKCSKKAKENNYIFQEEICRSPAEENNIYLLYLTASSGVMRRCTLTTLIGRFPSTHANKIITHTDSVFSLSSLLLIR